MFSSTPQQDFADRLVVHLPNDHQYERDHKRKIDDNFDEDEAENVDNWYKNLDGS